MSEWKETGIGKIPKEWQIHCVLDLQNDQILLVEDGNHGNDRPRPNEFVEDGSSFVRAADVVNQQIQFSQASKINQTAYERIRKGKSKAGDIILTHKGTVGRVALVPTNYIKPFACSPQTTFYRTLNEDEINRKYLFFYLLSPLFQNQIKKFQGETDMAPYVSLTNQRSLLICKPHIKEQEEIGNTLWTIHSKIALLQNQNQTLEKIAQTLFKHWFIDFEFPNEDGKPYRSSGGKMVESDLGEIPDSWGISPLDEIGDYLNGLALQKYPPESEEEFLPVIKIKELKSGISDGTDKASVNIPKKYIIDNGDVIFSWSGSLEVVIWHQGKGALNQHLFKVTSKKYPKWFYYFWTLKYLPKFRHIAQGKATTMGHIQRYHLSEALCFTPEKEFLKKAEPLFASFLNKIINNYSEIHTLTKTRDTLLPKLMSGQIRIQDMETIIP